MSDKEKDAMEIVHLLQNMNSYESILDVDIKKREEDEVKLVTEKQRVEQEIKEMHRKILRLESRKNYLNNAIEDNRKKIQGKNFMHLTSPVIFISLEIGVAKEKIKHLAQ